MNGRHPSAQDGNEGRLIEPVYLDHNGSTPPTREVLEAMSRHLQDIMGNAGAGHPAGLDARDAIEAARSQVAAAIGATAEEVTFTSGGTEANNLAIFGLADRSARRRHLVAGRHEHASVLRPIEELERRGFEVTWLDPAPCGRILPEALVGALRPDTLLVALMLANNETGILQPVEEAAEAARSVGARLFVDAVCGTGKIPVDVAAIGADLLSLSGHKLHAPKGIGALYVRQGLELHPQIYGCGQQRGLRSGTENTMGSVALGAAAAAFATGLGAADAPGHPVRKLKDELWAGVTALFESAPAQRRPVRNGHGPDLPGTLSLWFPGLNALELQERLGAQGLSVAAQCARMSGGELRPSHVLAAMGASRDRATESLRFSLGSTSTALDVERALHCMSRALDYPGSALQSLPPGRTDVVLPEPKPSNHDELATSPPVRALGKGTRSDVSSS